MVGNNVDHIHRRDLYLAARPSRTNGLITIRCGFVSTQRQRRVLWKSLRESLSIPPFTRAFVKSPSSRGLSGIAELLVNFWHSDTLALSHERQSAPLPETENGRLDLRGTEHSKCNRLMTLGFKSVNLDTAVYVFAKLHRKRMELGSVLTT